MRHNVLFNGSCLLLKSFNIFYSVTVTVVNTAFVGCTRSPALSIYGIKTTNITVNATQSRTLMRLDANTLCDIQPQGHFYNNRGATVIFSNSRLTFYNANIRFINNTVRRGESTPISIKGTGSFVVFNNSYAIFENNRGKLCQS